MQRIARLCCGCCTGQPSGRRDVHDANAALQDAVALSHNANAKSGELTISELSVSGSGQILADQCILQDRAYWEATVEKCGGGLVVGVVSPAHAIGSKLTEGTQDGSCSWTWRAEGLVDGDVLGVALDQADFPVRLRFYVNGTQRADLRGPVTEATPVLELSGRGSAVRMNFGQFPFAHRLPGFDGLIRSRSLI